MRILSALLLVALSAPFAAAGDDDVSFSFPPTDTREFVHGLCVMGAQAGSVRVQDTNKYGRNTNLGYRVYPSAFGNGVQIWKDRRNYHAYDVEGPEMCEGGIYMQPSHHKKISLKTDIKLTAEPLKDEKVVVCAFVEDGHIHRDGQWDVELPKAGFKESDRFGWFKKGKTGWFTSFCKEINGHEGWTASAKNRGYVGGTVCAKGTGDPHFTTFDNLRYDCQGEGDYIMSKSLEGDFELQGRFEKVPGKSVTTTQGVVLRTGYADEPTVEVSYTKECELSYLVDGTPVGLEAVAETGYDKLEFYGKGSSRYFIYESGVSLQVNFRKYRGDCLLDSYLCIPGELSQENIVGILGSPDNKKDNDFMSRTGADLDKVGEYSKREINDYCTSTWCVPEADSLFDVPGDTDAACNVEYDDTFQRQVENADIKIKEACMDDEACIVDCIAADGDLEEGKRTLEAENLKEEPPRKSERKAFPSPPKEVPEPAPKTVEVCVQDGHTFKMTEILEADAEGAVKPGDEVEINGDQYTLALADCELLKMTTVCEEDEESGEFIMDDILEADAVGSAKPGETVEIDGIMYTLSSECELVMVRNGVGTSAPKGQNPNFTPSCINVGAETYYCKVDTPRTFDAALKHAPTRSIQCPNNPDLTVYGRLATPTTAGEVAWINGIDADNHINYWLGARKADPSCVTGNGVTCDWKWLDGTTVAGNWDVGQPTPGTTDEECFGISQYTRTTGFHDFPCDNTQGYIIEYDCAPVARITPPQTGGSSGDPHFKTWTGDKFDYHGQCDLVLLDNPTFHNGLGLRVHIRTTQVKYFSFIEQVAIQIGDEILEFNNDVENFYINGKHVGKNKKHHKTMLSGFVVRRDQKFISIRLQDVGAAARQSGTVAKIDLHARKNGFPAVIVDAGKTNVFKGSLGLIGEFGTGRTLARDGKTAIEVDAENAEAFALEWQVRGDADTSLFMDKTRYPQYPQVCTPAKKMLPHGRLGVAMAMEEAKEACSHWKHDVEDCIFDVMATRDLLVAEEGHIVHVE